MPDAFPENITIGDKYGPAMSTRARVERLFKCEHPIFGPIAESEAPTPAEALAAGIARGLAARVRS